MLLVCVACIVTISIYSDVTIVFPAIVYALLVAPIAVFLVHELVAFRRYRCTRFKSPTFHGSLGAEERFKRLSKQMFTWTMSIM